jgi:hypothetical protein
MTDLSTRLAEIRSLEEALHRPSVRRSRDALEQLLAKGFVEFGSSGAVYHRDELIVRLVQEDNDNDEVQTELGACDYALTSISTDAALLTYRTHHKESDGEQLVLRSSIWKYAEGRWQMLFHQGTLTKPAL